MASDEHRASTPWVRVCLEVPAEQVDLAADLLFGAGAAGIEEQPEDDAVRLLAGFEGASAAADAVARATAAGFGGGRVLAVADDGLDAWRAFAEPVRAGRFWITPTWLEAPPLGLQERILWVEPGRTFGSGSHPTTRLVLALLDQLVQPGDRMLDVGTGSGVLAVGAAMLEAEEAVGIDIDPASPAVAQANADANGVAGRVHASGRTLAEVAATTAPFDLVTANLLAPVIAELAPDLIAIVRPGGRLIASGLLADRWQPSANLLTPLELERVEVADGWAAVVLVRPGPTER